MRLIQAIKGLAVVRKLRPGMAPFQIATRLTDEKREPAPRIGHRRFAEAEATVLN